MFRHVRVDGGILSYILAIGLLVSVGLSMLVLYVYYARMEYKSYERRIRVIRNLESAMQIGFSDFDHFEYNRTYLFDLYGEGLDSVGVRRMEWGLLDLFVVTALSGEVRDTSVYSIGHQRQPQGKSALYLVDEGRPLSLAGDAKLTGICYLPLAGIQSGYVGRVGYKNEKLVYGEERRSEKELPEVGLKDKMKSVKEYEAIPAPENDTLDHSFLRPALKITGSQLEVSGQYEGNIIIEASKSIFFSKDCRTVDVIAIAPVIEFEAGFEGDGQFLAGDTIIIGKDVFLRYPTVLAVYNEEGLGTIQTRGKADINGWILIDGDEEVFRQRVIYLEDETSFRGMIYCNGLLETYCSMTGHATVKRFLVNAPTAVYENYMLNAQIDATALDTTFLALSEWFHTDEVRILKYLD